MARNSGRRRMGGEEEAEESDERWLLTYADMVGLDQAPALGRLVGGVDAVFGSIFISAIEVAGPVLLALILTDAAFGVVSRVVPQLNVFAVGFPAKIVVGLLLVTATLPFVAGWIGSELQQDVGAALQAIQVA